VRNLKLMKRRLALSFALLLFSTSLLVMTSFAWFTALLEDDFSGRVGFVDVDLDVYFDDGLGGRIEATPVEIAPGVTKPGVYSINIVDSLTTNHFEQFRIYIIIKSNVDTYLRVKIYEQLTLTYINFEGVVTELSILIEDFLPFNYDLTDWYDNRTIDNYLYLKNKVKRIDETTPLTIGLVTSYFPNETFANYSAGYSLQISIGVEAIQAFLGPQNVWDLPSAPWGVAW
jgi:hypothetical protein